jgi:hypothetical protein
VCPFSYIDGVSVHPQAIVPVDTPCGSGGFLSADTLLLALYMGFRRGGQGQADAFHQGALAQAEETTARPSSGRATLH